MAVDVAPKRSMAVAGDSTVADTASVDRAVAVVLVRTVAVAVVAVSVAATVAALVAQAPRALDQKAVNALESVGTALREAALWVCLLDGMAISSSL